MEGLHITDFQYSNKYHLDCKVVCKRDIYGQYLFQFANYGLNNFLTQIQQAILMQCTKL